MTNILYPNRLQGQSIRLLEVLAGNSEETVQCRLGETALEDAADRYVALSYVWGDPTVTEDIQCNGQDIQITTNLAQALRAIRPSRPTPDTGKDDHVSSSSPSRLLWADAICINQQDVLERNNQVQLMKDIYSKADGVVVWVGPDEDGQASNAFATIKQVLNGITAYHIALEQLRGTVEQIRDAGRAPSWLGDRPHFTFDLCETALRSVGLKDPWGSLRTFFLLPWWSRIWCVQEVYLAKKVIIFFGTQALDGKTLITFTEWYMRESTFENAKGIESRVPKELNDAAIQKAYNRFNHRNLYGGDLFLVCEDFRNLQATNARDKVYGVLGLWRPTSADHATLEVNYDKSVAEVYTDVTMQAIQDRKDLFILRFVDHEAQYSFEEDASFPSWVPRWDRGDPWQFMWLDKSPIRASKYAAELPDQELARSGVLKVKGVLFDRVIWTSDVLEKGPISFFTNAEFQTRFVRFYKEASGLEPNTDFAHQISVAELATTVSSGFIKVGNEMLDKDADDPNAWLDIADLETDIGRAFINRFRTFMDTETYPGDPKAFHKMMFCKGKRLFRTSRGYLGLGRRNLREGDFVTVLHGGRVPHALRLNPKSFFSYVGDCYVYDIMNMQVYDKFDEEGVMPGVFEVH